MVFGDEGPIRRDVSRLIDWKALWSVNRSLRMIMMLNMKVLNFVIGACGVPDSRADWYAGIVHAIASDYEFGMHVDSYVVAVARGVCQGWLYSEECRVIQVSHFSGPCEHQRMRG